MQPIFIDQPFQKKMPSGKELCACFYSEHNFLVTVVQSDLRRAFADGAERESKIIDYFRFAKQYWGVDRNILKQAHDMLDATQARLDKGEAIDLHDSTYAARVCPQVIALNKVTVRHMG